jgi:hypothetical protein
VEKEELESANEELNTVNEEMQHRNQQLAPLNNDLINLLNSVNIPIVMLGPDLSVRRFTLQAEKLLGLSAVDVGRPISNIRMKVSIADLEQWVEDVIRDVIPKQEEFTVDRATYSLRITPIAPATTKSRAQSWCCWKPQNSSKEQRKPRRERASLRLYRGRRRSCCPNMRCGRRPALRAIGGCSRHSMEVRPRVVGQGWTGVLVMTYSIAVVSVARMPY